MLTKRLGAAVTLAALLASDLGLGVSSALAQTQTDGHFALPSITPIPSITGDGAGVAVPAPRPLQIQPQPVPPRQFSPAQTSVCQPAGSQRVYQVAATPRRQAPPPPATQPGAATVTQVTVTQGAAAPQAPAPEAVQQTVQQPPVTGQGQGDVIELSRIEAAFNLDPIRQASVPMGARPELGATAPARAQRAAVGRRQELEQPVLQQAGQPDAGQAPTMLGPFGTPLRQYGYSMFAANVSTFAPVDDIPVGPDYVLGPGDDLTINVWGAVDSTIVRTVDRNGRIVLPKVGDLRIWGLTFSQADRLIREQLARYFRGFQTSVTMGRLRTVTVHVVGEVCQPGVYTLSALSTVTNALFSAGGPTKLGSLREVRLIRGSSQVAKLDLYDFLQRGDRTRDYRLESGDTIFVPTIGAVVAVAGEVKRPAIYEIRGDAHVSDVIAMAGGVTPASYLKRVQIVRSQPSAERVTLDVDLSGFYLRGDDTSNPSLNAGDLVLIHRSDPRVYNTVRVEGAVKYPGAYELKPMMRISQLLPPDKLLPEAYPDRVEISRRRADLSLEIVSVDLRKAWANEAGQDVLLRPLDQVTVRTELKPARSVTLTGQVIRPGVYTIAEGETLSSVLERAGGFTDRANLKGALFTRAALRKSEQEQLEAFLKLQEQRMLAAASTVIVGAEKEDVAAQQAALQARRETLKLLASKVAVGRMVVHLDAPDKLRGSANDVVLTDGDTLDVPEPAQSVLVIGAVRNSTSVQFKEGAGADYYINRVGGFSREADKKEVYIAKADGSAISSFTNIRDVEPGDAIIVPPKEEEKIRTLPTVRDALQAIGSALLGVAALAVLF